MRLLKLFHAFVNNNKISLAVKVSYRMAFSHNLLDYDTCSCKTQWQCLSDTGSQSCEFVVTLHYFLLYFSLSRLWGRTNVESLTQKALVGFANDCKLRATVHDHYHIKNCHNFSQMLYLLKMVSWMVTLTAKFNFTMNTKWPNDSLAKGQFVMWLGRKKILVILKFAS